MGKELSQLNFEKGEITALKRFGRSEKKIQRP